MDKENVSAESAVDTTGVMAASRELDVHVDDLTMTDAPRGRGVGAHGGRRAAAAPPSVGLAGSSESAGQSTSTNLPMTNFSIDDDEAGDQTQTV